MEKYNFSRYIKNDKSIILTFLTRSFKLNIQLIKQKKTKMGLLHLNSIFSMLRDSFYDIVKYSVGTIARLLGYPNNPGMKVYYEFPGEQAANMRFLADLPKHETNWPPPQNPENLVQTIFGPIPQVDLINRFFYENNLEGFYNFYVIHYKNIYFLPNWLSKFIQVKCHICTDITILEFMRESLFALLVLFLKLVMTRTTLFWFIAINPYGFPFSILPALVDWAEDIFQGFVPVVLGTNVSSFIILGLFGRITDSLNHLVFTMPFLPSEGEETKLIIDGELTNVIIFHYLPALWYRYPIPNELRQHWYNDRPEILEYMQKAYSELNIQFLPDPRTLNELVERISNSIS